MVAAKTASLQLARRDWIPDPAVSIEAQRYNGASQAASELDAGLSFTVPWVNSPKYSAETREAENDLRAAQSGLQRARAEAVGMLRDALEKVETQHHHVELFREKLVPLARQAFEAGQLGYQGGQGGFAEWIAAQRNLGDLESMERQHFGDYQVAVTELEALIGAHFTPSK